MRFIYLTIPANRLTLESLGMTFWPVVSINIVRFCHNPSNGLKRLER